MPASGHPFAEKGEDPAVGVSRHSRGFSGRLDQPLDPDDDIVDHWKEASSRMRAVFEIKVSNID
jgi:hypothetical protein